MGAHGPRALRGALVAVASVLAGLVVTGVGAAQAPDVREDASALAPPVEAVDGLLAGDGALVPGTPCGTTANACVDVDRRLAWLVGDGRVVRGPVPMMPGGADEPTPRGTFTVQWKAEQYTSREHLVQMPYSVFFADGGIAFHEGRQDTNSAGCVKLAHDDAVAFFRALQVGDEVQVR